MRCGEVELGRSAKWKTAVCGGSPPIGGGDVAAIAPFLADVDALFGLSVFSKAERAEHRRAGLEALGGGVGIDAAEDVEQADAGHEQQHQRHQAAEAEDAAKVDLEALDRLGEDGVDRLLADVGGDAEGGQHARW